MYRAKKIQEDSKANFYNELCRLLEALIGEEKDWLANMANAAGLLFDQLEDINWAGFYILRENALVLGPFQGKPACTRIPMGKGVCGTCAASGKPLAVGDVHNFPGHIPCDASSRSELVVPYYLEDTLAGVLDLDSPVLHRFDEEDVQGIQEFLNLLQRLISAK